MIQFTANSNFKLKPANRKTLNKGIDEVAYDLFDTTTDIDTKLTLGELYLTDTTPFIGVEIVLNFAHKLYAFYANGKFFQLIEDSDFVETFLSIYPQYTNYDEFYAESVSEFT